MQAAGPDSHDDASGHGERKSNSLSNSHSALLCLGLDLVDIPPVGSGEIDHISCLDLASVEDNVSVLVVLLGLQVINEVANSLFVLTLLLRL